MRICKMSELKGTLKDTKFSLPLFLEMTSYKTYVSTKIVINVIGYQDFQSFKILPLPCCPPHSFKIEPFEDRAQL